mgnify:CR=1 FL=1
MVIFFEIIENEKDFRILLNKIGKILKQERIKNKLTLKALSNMNDISISTLSNIENDKMENISGVFLYRLSKVFNIDYDYLLRLRWDIFPTFLYERKSSVGYK